MILRNPAYKELYNTDKRYIILTGGRGSGKSFEASNYVTLSSFEGHNILYTRYTMTSAQISIIPEFAEKIELLELQKYFEVNNKEIYNLRNPCGIYFRGLKTGSKLQTANLKGVKDPSLWVLDEAEELHDQKFFDKVNYTIRKNNAYNRIVLIMNPTTRDHFIYQKFFKDTHKIVKIDGFDVEISTHPDVCHIHTTYLDNLPNLNEDFIKLARDLKEKDPKRYQDVFMGSFSNTIDEPLFRYLEKYEGLNQEPDGKIAFIDTADQGDDDLVMTIGYLKNRNIFIEDVLVTDKPMEYTLVECAKMLNKHKVDYCRVESNNGGRLFAVELQKLVSMTEILTAHETRNKHTRIIMNEPFVNTFVKFHKDLSPVFLSQLRNYSKLQEENKKNKDDCIDSLTGLCTFIKGIFKDRYYDDI